MGAFKLKLAINNLYTRPAKIQLFSKDLFDSKLCISMEIRIEIAIKIQCVSEFFAQLYFLLKKSKYE